MAATPNLLLTLPLANDLNWGNTINANMGLIDTAVATANTNIATANTNIATANTNINARALLAGNAAQVFSVAAPTANGHAVRIVGYATFSVSAGVLTVHKQVGMTLTRSAAGTFPFTFTVAQPDVNWTSAVNHVRIATWTNTGEYVVAKTTTGGTLAFIENSVVTDPAAAAASASSIIIFAS